MFLSKLEATSLFNFVIFSTCSRNKQSCLTIRSFWSSHQKQTRPSSSKHLLLAPHQWEERHKRNKLEQIFDNSCLEAITLILKLHLSSRPSAEAVTGVKRVFNGPLVSFILISCCSFSLFSSRTRKKLLCWFCAEHNSNGGLFFLDPVRGGTADSPPSGHGSFCCDCSGSAVWSLGHFTLRVTAPVSSVVPLPAQLLTAVVTNQSISKVMVNKT